MDYEQEELAEDVIGWIEQGCVAAPAEDNITATHLPLLCQLKPVSSGHLIVAYELRAHTYYIT